ncbi:hypothetical protein ZOSMA_177G00110 [Zostera marina]|uniref:Uncharacterized protein n=1 Tax=Zostera marina TaxID=29655 RepID=A0A0K9PRK4_ZOSMR|nr:hypothetical protein ZOSMA_177G00110 [Zostera marina]
MAAPVYSTPFQPYVYQSPESSVTPFQILGGEAQIVQIMLKSLQKVTAKPGSMCYMSGSIQMDNVYALEQDGGVWQLQWIFGKTAISINLLNSGSDDGYVGIAAPSPGRILPIDLANFGGELLCQPDAFLCSVNDVTVSNSLEHPRGRNIMPGAEIVLRQKLVGQGLAFLVSGGSVAQKTLQPGETLVMDSACIIAMTSTISFQIKNMNARRAIIFGGENHMTVSLTGPGVVFIQSLPFYRLSKHIARAVTSTNMRENPRFFIQIAIFFFLAYAMIVSSLILTDV